MKIDLGQHTAVNGQQIQAWIEPNCPVFRAGTIRDDGFLCITVDSSTTADKIDTVLRFESMSEDLHRLCEAVGHELARTLWAERLNYDEKPFFWIYDHVRAGRLYMECADAEGSIAMSTRFDSLYPNERTVLHAAVAASQLNAMLVSNQILSNASRFPDSTLLARATAHADDVGACVHAARQEFAAIVDWEFDSRLSAIMLGATGRLPLTEPGDIERFDRISARAIRPPQPPSDQSPFDFITERHTEGGPQMAAHAVQDVRWNTIDGVPRMEPLTIGALTQELHGFLLPMTVAQALAEEHAVSAADWAWFREKRLGRMEQAVSTLHELIAVETASSSPDEFWLAKARQTGDFCTTMPASPQKIYAVISEIVALPGRLTVEQLGRAQNALNFMQDPASGLVVDNGIPQRDAENTEIGLDVP